MSRTARHSSNPVARPTRREFLHLAAAGGAVLLVNLRGCNWAGDDPADPAPGAVADRRLKGGTNVTFFVAADTHFGHPGINMLNAWQIGAMNSLPGTPLPGQLGGLVQPPRGVLIAGDLTENGRAAHWDTFVEHYGLTGTDAMLKYPVYECTGNHDRDPILFETVPGKVSQRHGNVVYSWDWDDVHIACLDVYPSTANVRWLKRDLARVGRKVPVVLYFHYSITGPFSDWWDSDEKRAFREAIDGYNIVGIFHGHYHYSMRYRWEGYDVYNVGAPRHRWHSFATVHITDTAMSVASWDWERRRWNWSHRKAINHPAESPTAISVPRAPPGPN